MNPTPRELCIRADDDSGKSRSVAGSVRVFGAVNINRRVAKSLEIGATLVTEHAASILESCGEAIIYASPDGTVPMVNAAAASMFDCSQNDAIGRPLSSFRPPSQWTKQREAFARVLGGEALVVEMIALRGDGREFPTAATLSPVVVDGFVEGVSAIVRDLFASGRFRDGALDMVEFPPAFARVESSGDATVVVVGTTIVFASKSAVEMVGAQDATEDFCAVLRRTVETTQAEQASTSRRRLRPAGRSCGHRARRVRGEPPPLEETRQK